MKLILMGRVAENVGGVRAVGAGSIAWYARKTVLANPVSNEHATRQVDVEWESNVTGI
jgi:hypothetical protein